MNFIKAPCKLIINLSDPGYNKKSRVKLKQWEDGGKDGVPGRTHDAYFPTEHISNPTNHVLFLLYLGNETNNKIQFILWVSVLSLKTNGHMIEYIFYACNYKHVTDY